MSALYLIRFLLGSGLVMLGAFFLWRLVGNKPWGAVLGVLLPVSVFILLASVCGATEMAAGVLWGVVALNYGIMGMVSLCRRGHGIRGNELMSIMWVTLGLGVCGVARYSGHIGMFSGWGLVAVGLVALWQMLTPKTNFSIAKQIPKQELQIRCWVILFCAVVFIVVGAWLVVWRYMVLAAVFGLPESLIGAVVVASLCGLSALFGWRVKRQWQTENLLFGLTRGNALLATVGLGLVAVLNGGLPLTQSTLFVTLPWVTGLTVVSAVSVYLPQKTARWWGGLIIAIYVGYVLSLLW